MKIYRGIVLRTVTLGPSLVRITLGGPGVADFVSTGTGDEYVRLFFPHGDDPTDVSLPIATADSWETAEGTPEAPMRTFTIREVRPELGELDIDFVIHPTGIAGPWAAAAQPGHVLGLNSPTGLYAPPEGTEWQVLAADLTGLPAVARIIASVPETIRTRVVIEVPSDADRIALPAGANVDVTWVFSGNGHGPSALGQIVRSVINPRFSFDHGYVWVAGETVALRDVRKFLRRELELPATQFKVVGYWTPVAQWESKYAALPAAVQQELMSMWDVAEDADLAEVELRYEARLGELGL
ncbi:Iron-chelator utilization protein [Leucobacter sp. 7(1)]|uniref:siderophore-interacting protein n=1 Tax=Leucobacter sp. 7(1) TaxID=1255613 RepID=UPI00097EE9F0|nr:siderophore-interacting protein [Leucobacter sp. 7(1)]SJN10751.1 Iron-chelator utilization protein [Leucobacter sp. 7(1)]